MSDEFMSCQPLLDRLTHVVQQAKLMTQFQKLSTIEEKILFCLKEDKIKYDEDTFISIRNEISDLLEVFYSNSKKHVKSEETAEQLKTKGSKAFMRKRDEEAYRLYTDALRYAPSEPPLLAVLYANRSATHIQRKKYEECLEDIERAEKAGYPTESQYKLHKRKLEALLKLGRKKEAQRTLQRAKECHFPVGKDAFSNSLKELEKEISKMNIKDDTSLKSVHTLPELFMGDKEKEISGALEIRVNAEDGRHIRAISDIPKGAALFRENPFAAILLPEHFLTHCQRCFCSLTNPIPCNICSDIFWCGEKCKAEGEMFHQYECCNLHILSSVGIAHLALRIVLTAGWPTCQQVRKEVKAGILEDPAILFHSRDKKSRYKSVYSLLTHLEKTPGDDFFQYSLAGIILGKVILERTQFLPSQCLTESSSRESRAEVLLSSLLVHHISQLVSNAHAITQIERKSEGETSPLSQISQKRIASAIYPLASLMNHSCKPKIINSFLNDVLVIHAVEEIHREDQVFNCYGPHASRQERKERQAALQRQYFFHCACTHCTSDESLLKEASWSGLKCPKCKGVALIDESKSDQESYTCLHCKSSEALPAFLAEKCSNANTFYEDGQDSLKNEKYEDAEMYFLKALRLGEEVFSDHNEFLNTIRDSLAKSYTLEGKYEKSLQELSLCLKIVGSRFGDESVEVAHELLKYLDVIGLANSLNHNLKIKGEKVRRRINRIFTTHYGAKWKSYLKLDDI